ncbi:MAG: sigma-70 family RNA polymerase sigma factor [Odoribacteraceae bacterium]|jgi:RNA polymerase sigma-70 factor (ECF subfamily)|nr:sigma-70 family RNA polymerase sigma factor [Odoribacteraceae bacterium]
MKKANHTRKHVADEELVQRYRKSRDITLLAELYGRYMTLVYGLSLKYLKRPEDAQDAVMQLFEQLVENLKTHQVNNFKPWLYACARNNCLMELRRRHRDISITLDENFMESPLDFHPGDTNPARDATLRECLDALPEKQRACVQAFFLEELSYKEVGERAGFSLKNVKSFIQNGKRNLKTCLESKGVSAHETE